jgi:hypothetical protein
MVGCPSTMIFFEAKWIMEWCESSVKKLSV